MGDLQVEIHFVCFFSVFLFSFFHSVSNFLGFQLVKALVSGSGSGIPLNQDIESSKLRAQLSHATLRFLDWLSSATLKIFISGVSSRILMPLLQNTLYDTL